MTRFRPSTNGPCGADEEPATKLEPTAPAHLRVIALSFAAATVFTHTRLLGIDRASLDIAEMRRLQVLSREYLDRRATGATASTDAIEEARRSMNQSIRDYLNLFEPYVQGGRCAKGGIGLGLATVKRLAEAHGGKVGVHSVPAEGCTFWFELPKAKQERRVSVAVAHAGAA